MTIPSTPPSSRLLATVQAMLPPGVALAGGRIGAATASPFVVENLAIERAVDKRRREFVAGREYARAALARFGVAAAPIAILPSRAPRWPDGFVGSISHSGDACVAVAASASAYAGIGIDVESAAPLAPELHATVLCPGELAAMGGDGRVDAAKMAFVVKEAFFKLYHPLTGRFIDFLDARVRLDDACGAFELQLRDAVPALHGARTFAGVCADAGDTYVAFVALQRR